MEATNSNRRKFLKKAVYAAPAVIALGALSTPASARVIASSVIYSGNGQQIVVTPGSGSASVSNNGNNVVIPTDDPNLGDFADFLNN